MHMHVHVYRHVLIQNHTHANIACTHIVLTSTVHVHAYITRARVIIIRIIFDMYIPNYARACVHLTDMVRCAVMEFQLGSITHLTSSIEDKVCL